MKIIKSDNIWKEKRAACVKMQICFDLIRALLIVSYFCVRNHIDPFARAFFYYKSNDGAILLSILYAFYTVTYACHHM